MNKTWKQRQIWSQKAVEIFNNIAEYAGFKIIKPMGVEFDDEIVYAELFQRDDRTSIMLRHRPDALGFTADEAVLLQIKGTSKEPPVMYFHVEVDSWRGALEWNKAYRHVAFVFVPVMEGETVLFAWADELHFRKITIPMRPYGYRTWQEEQERMEQIFHDKTVFPAPHKGGSGTPYFTVHRSRLHEFIDISSRTITGRELDEVPF